MNVLYCADSNVCVGIALSALSIVQQTNTALNVFILTARIEQKAPVPRSFADNLERSLRLKNKDSCVTLIDITDKFEGYVPLANMSTRFTPFCMLRLFADKVDLIPDKVLYLDTDVICFADITSLYETELYGFDVAGVPDRYGKWFFGNILKHDYLNSGVLLMNMKSIRENGLFEKCRRLCRDKKMFMPDQSAINKLAVKKKLAARYNDQRSVGKDTALRHYTTFFRLFPYVRPVTVKPWQIERMHKILKTHELDELISEYERMFG